MTTTATNNVNATANKLNGIDLDLLQGAVEAVKADPAAGQTHWSVTSKWQGGARTDHHVDGCEVGGEKVDRQFKIQVDEPLQLCGTNQFANPQEHLLSAMNACMMVGYASYAALMGIKLTKLEIETSGDIDLRGYLDIDESVPNGYPSLKQTVRLAGDATEEQLKALHEVAIRTSVNYFNITQAIPVQGELVLE